MKAILLTLVITVPLAAAAFSITGGYQLAAGPQDDIASYLGFSAGVEQALGLLRLNLEYTYAEYNRNRHDRGIDYIPEDTPVSEWRCHGLGAQAEYPLFRSRVSPYVSGGVGAVWYDYDITEYGLWEIPDPDLAFAVSVGGGVDVRVRPALTLFVKSSYERHFTKILDMYHHGTGESEYTDIEFSGLNIKTGMSVGVF
jgi:opacity protein-like surface antigen